jgi:hypothetical protein
MSLVCYDSMNVACLRGKHWSLVNVLDMNNELGMLWLTERGVLARLAPGLVNVLRTINESDMLDLMNLVCLRGKHWSLINVPAGYESLWLSGSWLHQLALVDVAYCAELYVI